MLAVDDIFRFEEQRAPTPLVDRHRPGETGEASSGSQCQSRASSRSILQNFGAASSCAGSRELR
jgi:hypothetical protein